MLIAGITRAPALTQNARRSNLKPAFVNFPAQGTRSEARNPRLLITAGGFDSHRAHSSRWRPFAPPAFIPLPMPKTAASVRLALGRGRVAIEPRMVGGRESQRARHNSAQFHALAMDTAAASSVLAV
jgi:hypothetical protein